MNMHSILIVSVLALFLFLACSSAPESQSPVAIQEELDKLKQALLDRDFMTGVARAQEAAYYDALGQAVPSFISAEDSSQVILKSLRDERIAATLSSFYALECGISAMTRRKRGTTPLTILQQVEAWRIDTTSKLLLRCFADATWRTGQPFMSLKSIVKVQPNYEVQLRLVAKKMIADLEDVAGGSCQMQTKKIRHLMQDSTYMHKMAEYIDPAILKTETGIIERSKYEEKVATNLPGAFALECGITFLAKTKQQLPSALIRSINENTISEEDMMLMCRFANATWKSSQPFRGLNRIKGSTFIPFSQLSDEEVEKDRVQIRSAAGFFTQNVFSGTQKHY
ncbi:hypothetical protein OI18_00380 [Flavihumibacter solisilvae]|uniref:Uncharacterized protein n=2 Tax=Flavihumibacter solisilvae TaxID=1349421 RepID=A0A0C1IPU6_9BACT|nr:hypothetical protein OI18_00380 [Flavihumibacter solisilvae]